LFVANGFERYSAVVSFRQITITFVKVVLKQLRCLFVIVCSIRHSYSEIIMTSTSELFDEAVRSRGMGPRLADDSPERRDGGLQKILSWFDSQTDGFRTSSLCTKRFPRVIIDVVDNPITNARAFRSNDLYIIVIYKGVLNTLNYMYSRLLCCDHVMPTVGDVRRERKDLPVFQLTAN
jgi:hypothetical protein